MNTAANTRLTSKAHRLVSCPPSCCHVRMSSSTHLGFYNLAWVRHEHDQPTACGPACIRGTHCLQTHLSSVVCCLHTAPSAVPEGTKILLFVPGCMCLCKLHGQPACMPFAMSGLTITKQLQVASYYCDVCVCKHVEHLLHVTQHACHPSKHCTNGQKRLWRSRHSVTPVMCDGPAQPAAWLVCTVPVPA